MKNYLKNNLIFWLAIFFSSYISYHAFKKYFYYKDKLIDENFYLVIFFLFCFFFILNILFLFFSKKNKIFIFKSYFLIFISAIFIEFFCSIKFDNIKLNYLIFFQNLEFDKRSGKELFEKYNLYPSFPVSTANFTFIHNNKKYYPLSNISNSKVFLPNEEGFYPIYQSDKYGFNNQSFETNPDIILIGDSFVEGCCVESSKNIAGNLLRNYKVLNLGKIGNGPLVEYATYIEYAKDIEAKYVFWFFFDNDIQDLYRELNSEILSKYVNIDNYYQNLKQVNNIKDIELNKFYYKKFNKARSSNYINSFERLIKLTSSREKFKFGPKNEPKIYDIFEDLILKVKNNVEKNKGEFYFVYLPSIHWFNNFNWKSYDKDILNIIQKNNIKYIDVYDIFKKNKNPKKLFPFQLDRHYTSEGYKIIADSILIEIR